jgi:hypothetical protein
MAATDDGGMQGPERTGISRRRVLQGAVAGGALVWAAPVIDSVATGAAAVSTPCAPPGNYTLSGLTILYYRGGILYWTFIGQNTSVCDAAGGSISNDTAFTTTCGNVTLGVNTPTDHTVTVTVGAVSTTPINDATCYFEATSRGANLTPAGVTAGVQVLAWIAHNGSFKADPVHFMVHCGSNCTTF